jgi:hypothetical protein
MGICMGMGMEWGGAAAPGSRTELIASGETRPMMRRAWKTA